MHVPGSVHMQHLFRPILICTLPARCQQGSNQLKCAGVVYAPHAPHRRSCTSTCAYCSRGMSRSKPAGCCSGAPPAAAAAPCSTCCA
eukprot:344517-Chlamydomonas_euryale.AAC.2